MLPQGVFRRVWVSEVHGVAPALGVGQPQQQGVEGLVELLSGEQHGSGI